MVDRPCTVLVPLGPGRAGVWSSQVIGAQGITANSDQCCEGRKLRTQNAMSAGARRELPPPPSLPSPFPSFPPPPPPPLSLSLPQLFSSGHSKSTPWQAMNQSELFLLSCENVYNIENPACGFTLCIFSENLTGFPSRWRTVQPRGLSALGQSVPGGRPPSRPSVRGRLRVRAQRAQPYFLATLTL